MSEPVRVALLDTGINPWHSHVRGVARAVSFEQTSAGLRARRGDTRDLVGHGTALAGVIRHWAPRCELWSARVLDRELRGSFAVLEAALTWALDEGAQVINMSLGTRNPDHVAALTALAERAQEQGVLLVAAYGRDGAEPEQGAEADLPANVPGVISVGVGAGCSFECPVESATSPPTLRACPTPRDLPGLASERNFRGPSVSTAHVAGLLAGLLEDDLGAGQARLLERLRSGELPR